MLLKSMIIVFTCMWECKGNEKERHNSRAPERDGTGYSERHLNNLYSTTYSYKGGNFRPSSQKEVTEHKHFKRSRELYAKIYIPV